MEQKECVVCRSKTYHKIQNKETNAIFPFCLDCRYKGFYNEEIFDFISPRGEIKG